MWPDIQAGFRRDLRSGWLDPTHDRRALDVALQLTRHVQPDDVVLLGDNLDLPDWSRRFVHSPEYAGATQAAAVELAWWLAQVDAPRKRYIAGNHEHRIERLLMADAVPAYGLVPVDDPDRGALLGVPRLLGLDGLGWEYVGPYPTGEVWLNDHLRLHHGELARSGSGATVRTAITELQHSEGQGHVHRMELAAKTAWSRRGPMTVMAFSPGTLARIDPGVVPASRHRQNWQQGVAVVEYEPGDGAFHTCLVPIHQGRALYDGRRFTARQNGELVRRIERDTGFRLS